MESMTKSVNTELSIKFESRNYEVESSSQVFRGRSSKTMYVHTNHNYTQTQLIHLRTRIEFNKVQVNLEPTRTLFMCIFNII